ncbi:uncharacterized protein LOC110033511 [Phalaenopsis equestris]|uniref:uncharacterized protein LOC110033511 n=1 Tax=Phalaenopsis equestris TaxID=78828 RepID=UPI0009E5D5A9|nr:uncharacterized protein LOC110033511 [Phalaenopsis equestris]
MAKYCKYDHPGEVTKKVGDSRTCIQMRRGREDIEKFLIWELVHGEINFWKDKWCPTDHLEPLQQDKEEDLLVKDCWSGNEWSEDALNTILKESSAERISKIHFDRNKKDQIHLIKRTSSSLSKDIQNSIFRGDNCQCNIFTCKKFLTPSMLFFSWRVLNDLIPTDDILKLKGLKVISRCHLCKNNQEFSDHLFFSCRFSRDVWKHLTSKFNLNLINVGRGNIKENLKDWQEINLMSLPFSVAWFLWNARNNVKYEDIGTNPNSVGSNCQAYLQKLISWKKFHKILKNLPNIELKQLKVIKVRWEKPPYPFIKINTDGSFTNRKAGIGGIFRDHTSKVLLYFKAPYIAADALDTEATALYWALNFSMEIQWNKINAEVDSYLLVDLITENTLPPWHII